MAFANHDHVGAGVSRDDFRHRSKKLVRAPLCLGRRRSGIFPGSCFLPVELVSERIPHANSRLVPGGDSCIVRFWRSALRNLFGNGRRRRTRRLEMAFPARRTADDSARNHLSVGPYQSPRGSALADCGGTTGRCGADRKSTRLNSSHLVISYAVFCLKKKKISYLSTLYSLLSGH